MYSVSVSRSFVAQHFLTVPDAGLEGELHSHHYTATVEFRGPALDDHDYLLDIDAASAAVDALADEFRDTTLNDHPAFEGANPSVERLCRVLHDRARARLDAPGVSDVAVTLHEDDVASATYRAPLD